MQYNSSKYDIQMALRDEIKSACDYRPFEKCDYSSRIANEICCKKLEYVMLKNSIDAKTTVRTLGTNCTMYLI
ncbi:hypothetical protein RchiOBHm_Chr7g0240711 [Rosa chinensis]|uniref:Uncharacterized protein n=1 Tax=Rosa chinensis TaxID=74649 RepID=A0A2P6PI21_ROSCH|nr:hypothetical protein RchiOBHm_Chr7g0240711 [Rosa chinensis]